MKKLTHEQIHNAAHAAGMAAGQAVVCTPMLIAGYAPVMDGVCGFAWVRMSAKTGFSRWLRAKQLARKDDYRGGISMNVWEFRQSLTRKEAYASAYVAELARHGITAYADSRID